MIRSLIFSLLLIFFLLNESLSFQEVRIPPPNDSIPNRQKDSVCFKYSFNRGDTLTYSVTSQDSIIINYGAPLTKVRREILRVVCDSISLQGTFFLSLENTDFLGFESYGANRNLEVRENPWLNRKVFLEIDSLGKRISWNLSDSIHPAMSSGGAFQPYLFFWLKEPCKAIEETWMISLTDELPENGLPIPLLRNSILFHARPSLDTLNEYCNVLDFIKTGQGNITLSEQGGEVKVNSVINSFGRLYFSRKKNLPIHFYNTIEQKLTIIAGKDDQQPGWHYVTSYFTLTGLRPYVPPPPVEKKIVPEVKKKKSNKR